jgi:hypothetical protein
MAGDGRHLAVAPARTVGAARATGPAGRHARPPETHRGGTAGPHPAASLGAPGLLRAESTGVPVPRPAGGTAGLLRASIAAAPGRRTMAGFVLLLVVRPAKAPVAAPHRAAGLAVRRRKASAATLRRVATSAAPGGRPTPGHGGPLRGTQGEARDPRAAPRGLRPVLRGAGEIPIARVHGLRAKGRLLVMTVVTGHRGQPAAGPATPGQVTRARVARAQPVAGQAPGAGTRHGPAAGVRTRPQRAVRRPPTWPGRRFLIWSTPSSSSRKRGPS